MSNASGGIQPFGAAGPVSFSGAFLADPNQRHAKAIPARKLTIHQKDVWVTGDDLAALQALDSEAEQMRLARDRAWAESAVAISLSPHIRPEDNFSYVQAMDRLALLNRQLQPLLATLAERQENLLALALFPLKALRRRETGIGRMKPWQGGSV